MNPNDIDAHEIYALARLGTARFGKAGINDWRMAGHTGRPKRSKAERKETKRRRKQRYA